MVNASSGFADGWAGNTPDSMAAHFLFSDKRLLSLSRTSFRGDIIPTGCTLVCCLVAHRYSSDCVRAFPKTLASFLKTGPPRSRPPHRLWRCAWRNESLLLSLDLGAPSPHSRRH